MNVDRTTMREKGLNMGMRFRHPRMGRRLALAALVGAFASAVLGASVVAAANNITVSAFFGDCQFAGAHAGSGKTVKIDWRDSSGNVKSKHSVTSNSAGNFLSRCELGELIEKGDILKTTIGTSTRSFAVPRLVARTDGDVVSGKTSPAPANLLVEVLTYNGGFSAALGTWHTSSSLNLTGEGFSTYNGTWDVDPNIRGWDDVYVEWINGRGDVFIRHIVGQAVRVWIRQQFIEVAGPPGDSATVFLSDPSYTLRGQANGRLNRDGFLSTDFLNEEGDPVRVMAGDRIQGSSPQTANFQVPSITATISKGMDRVAANCESGSGYGVLVQARTRDFSKASSRTGYADGSGNFLANFATGPSYNIVAGDKVDIYCKLLSGDVVARTITVL